MKIRAWCLVVLVCAVLALVFAVPAVAASFGDVQPDHPYYTAINGMAERGVIGGYSNGNFGPSDPVTRQQFAKMVVLAMGLTVQESDFPNPGVPFIDLGADDPASLYPHEYVAVCALNSITTGKTPTTFEPLSNITRQQMISMVVRAADNLASSSLKAVPAGWTGKLSYADVNHGANIQKAEYNGLLAGLNGGGDLAAWGVTGKATRGEVAQVLWNLVNLREASLAWKWADLAPSGSALPRREHSMVYVPGQNTFVLFGGTATSPSGADLWDPSTYQFDPTKNEWSNLNVSNGPVARWGQAMVYCEATGKVILFGGHNWSGGQNTDLNDTWQFDPVAKTWTRLSPSGALPPGRAGHLMVYLPSTKKIVVYGGMYLPTGASGYAYRKDTWSYDPVANSWSELHPAHTPDSVNGSCYGYDPAGKKVFLFGGVTAGFNMLNQVWTFDPATNDWTHIAASGAVPLARDYCTGAFDPVSGVLVVFGGIVKTDVSAPVAETWAYCPASNSWKQLETSVRPPARYSGVMVYDPVGKRMILHGGIPKMNEGRLGDTWALTPR